MKASSFPFLSHDFPLHAARRARERSDWASRSRIVFSCPRVETENLVSSFPPLFLLQCLLLGHLSGFSFYNGRWNRGDCPGEGWMCASLWLLPQTCIVGRP